MWERRDGPPEDWNAPLPDHLAEEAEESYLTQWKRERTGEVEQNWYDDAQRKARSAFIKVMPSTGDGFCSIM